LDFSTEKNGNIGNPIMKIYPDFAKLAEEEKNRAVVSEQIRKQLLRDPNTGCN
jgi:hypothetical protein